MKKKNRLFKLMSAALVIAAMTTCMLSGTLAAYVSTARGYDSARVVKWGFDDGVIALDLFDAEYTNVASVGGSDVIAPGTTKSGTFEFAYEQPGVAPEVAYSFRIDVSGECADEIKKNKAITFSLDGDTYETDDEGSAYDKLVDAIKALSGDESGTKDYAAGELPDEFANASSHTIGWEWATKSHATYEVEAGSVSEGFKAQYMKYNGIASEEDLPETFELTQDEYDTWMGNAASLAEVSLTVAITASQLVD